MKKIFIAVMAIAAVTFSSCGNGAKDKTSECDSTACCCDSVTIEEPGVAEATETVDELKAAIASGKTEKIQEALAKAQAYVKQLAESDEAQKAAEYASRVKQFVDEHKQQIDSIAAGNETLRGIVSAVSAFPTTAEEAIKSVADDTEAMTEAAETKAEEAVDNAKKKAEEAVDNAKNKAEEAVDNAKETAKEKANKAIDDVANKLNKLKK